MISPLLLICIDLVDTLCQKVGDSHCIQADPTTIAVRPSTGHHESSIHSESACVQLLQLFPLFVHDSETRGVLAWKCTCQCFTSSLLGICGVIFLEHSFLFYNIITTLQS